MITATNATKRFEDITAVDHICAEVKEALLEPQAAIENASTAARSTA